MVKHKVLKVKRKSIAKKVAEPIEENLEAIQTPKHSSLITTTIKPDKITAEGQSVTNEKPSRLSFITDKFSKLNSKLKLKQLLGNKRFQLGAAVALLLISLTVLIFPLWPRLVYSFSKKDPNTIYYPISFPVSYAKSTQKLTLPTDPAQVKAIPLTNKLVIPKIGVDSDIIEGSTLDVLLSHEGVWHEPPSVTPDKVGNMVIAGHRFQYLPPNTHTFYDLDQITKGDKIIIFWNKKSYVYEVYLTETVTPDRIDIKNNDKKIPHELTLYTCTPLYTSEDRLVVKAKLVQS